jgi:parallel beta-helix repeat protein
VDGQRLTPTTVGVADSVPVNGFSYIAGQGLHVNLGGTSPGTHQTLVGRRSYGFNLPTRSFVTLDGFEMTRQESRGVYMQTGCTDLVISHNRVSFANSYGIQTANGMRIEIAANVVSDCNFHGIGLTGGSNLCTVHDNESFRNVDPAIRRANGIYMYGAPNNTLFRNRLHDNQDTGMQFSGGTNNCVAFNNRSWNNGDHGYDHLASSGNYHTNDVAYGNYKDGFSIEGNSPGTQLYNCIGVNNGLTTNEFDLWVDLESSVGFVSDYNVFWNATSQTPFKYIATQYATLAEYRSASGQDAHSRQSDPRFTNGPGGDFRLMAGSPAIDAANSGVANWPTTDAAGTGRTDDPATANTGVGPLAYADIGALEYLPTIVDRAPVVNAPGTVKGTAGSRVSFKVTASDPDGNPIASLVMVPTTLPANSGATFVTSADHKSGTFTWTPATTGTFRVDFIAANTLADTATTSIQVKAKSRHDAIASGPEEGMGEVALSNAFPNPSRGAVEFALELPHEADVRWAVFDLQGRTVWSEDLRLAAGRASLRWDGSIAGGGRAPNGVYLVRASVDGATFNRRVVRF